MYILASKFGANVYIILQFTLATTYAWFSNVENDSAALHRLIIFLWKISKDSNL